MGDLNLGRVTAPPETLKALGLERPEQDKGAEVEKGYAFVSRDEALDRFQDSWNEALSLNLPEILIDVLRGSGKGDVPVMALAMSCLMVSYEVMINGFLEETGADDGGMEKARRLAADLYQEMGSFVSARIRMMIDDEFGEEGTDK